MITRLVGTTGLLLTVLAVSATSARAQSAPRPAGSTEQVPSLSELFKATIQDFSRLPSRGTLEWLAVGGSAALATHSIDGAATHALADSSGLHEPFEAGTVLGGTPFELGAAFATYGLGRALGKPSIARYLARSSSRRSCSPRRSSSA